MAFVVAFLLGGAVLLAVGCAGPRSEAPKGPPQGQPEATTRQQGSPPEATAPEEARCEGTRTFDVFKKQGIDAVFDTSVEPGDPEARYTTNDLTGCPDGGPLSGTDKPDRLAGEEGEDEVRGLGAAARLTGGHGPDVIYGGSGDDVLDGGGGSLELGYDADSSKNVLHGEAGRDELVGDKGDDVLYGGAGDDKWLWGAKGEDVLYGGDGDDFLDGSFDSGERDELYCGRGKDEYAADKNDHVSSSCEKKAKMGAA